MKCHGLILVDFLNVLDPHLKTILSPISLAGCFVSSTDKLISAIRDNCLEWWMGHWAWLANGGWGTEA